MTTLTFTGASAPIHSDPMRLNAIGTMPDALSRSAISNVRSDREPPFGVLSLFRRCFGFLAREYRVHCGLRAMMALEDRMLSDIGLTRTEIGSAARYGRARTG
jgi:uncharacterized protein YjiS (DUF1127 family)